MLPDYVTSGGADVLCHCHELAIGFVLYNVHRTQRWSLHHELQLFERVLRRTPAPPPAGQQQQLGQQLMQQQEQQQQQHPFAPHLGWSLVPIAGLIRCMHGLYTQEMQVGFSTAGFVCQVACAACLAGIVVVVLVVTDAG